MAIIKKNFRIDAPVKEISFDEDEGAFYIEGIANSGLEDLVGDIVTTDALQQIVEQATNCNLHYNHESKREDILGPIVESKLVDEGAWTKTKILNEHKDWLKSYLEQGVKFGQSISGTCSYEENSLSDIIEWQLTEISLTDTPCDQATMGTVSISKSFDDCILEIKKQNQNEDMEETNMADEPKYITAEEATEIVNDAFNERKDEFLETIRDDIKKEYDAVINELKEQVDALKESTPAPAGEGEGEGAGKNEEEEEEEKGITEEELKELVDAKIKSIFDNATKEVEHKYDDRKGLESEEEERKTFDPSEIAKLL